MIFSMYAKYKFNTQVWIGVYFYEHVESLSEYLNLCFEKEMHQDH